MNSGILVFVLVLSIVLSSGIIIAVVLMKMAWTRKEREALTSTDLSALEESTVVLIDQLRAELDDRIAAMDERCKQMAELTRQADVRIAAFNKMSSALRNESLIDGSSIDIKKELSACISLEESDYPESIKDPSISAAEIKLMMRLADLGIGT